MSYKDPVRIKQYRDDHKTEAAAYFKRYREQNRTSLKQYWQRHYAVNRDAILCRVKKYVAANMDKVAIYQKAYLERPGKRETHNVYVKKHRIAERLICLKHYSNGKLDCICCGESSYPFLTIDHVNGGGHKHKIETNGHIYHWLIVNKFPEGYRVLCWNCNCAIGLYGYCPHKKVTELVA